MLSLHIKQITRKNKTRAIKGKGRKWSRKYKNSINCRRPKGFSFVKKQMKKLIL